MRPAFANHLPGSRFTRRANRLCISAQVTRFIAKVGPMT